MKTHSCFSLPISSFFPSLFVCMSLPFSTAPLSLCLLVSLSLFFSYSFSLCLFLAPALSFSLFRSFEGYSAHSILYRLPMKANPAVFRLRSSSTVAFIRRDVSAHIEFLTFQFSNVRARSLILVHVSTFPPVFRGIFLIQPVVDGLAPDPLVLRS